MSSTSNAMWHYQLDNPEVLPMSTERFPYDLPSLGAMVRLIQETKPTWNVQKGFVSFDDLRFEPIPAVPGRTFIEMHNKLTNTKHWFVYRRLDLAIVLGANVAITLTEAPTPRSIALELNRSRQMFFTADDLDFSNVEIDDVSSTVEYTLKALPGSYVYYGQTKVTVTVNAVSTDTRYTEDGIVRYTEDGTIRTLE